MSLRKFIEALRKENDFAEVAKTLNIEHEIGANIRRSCDDGGPALLMDAFEEQPTGEAPATGYSFKQRVVGGIYGTKRRVKKILDKRNDGSYGNQYEHESDLVAVKRYSEAADVNEKDKLCNFIDLYQHLPELDKYIQITGHTVDLTQLPICTHNAKDKGRFITAGVNVVKWVDEETHGLGIHRMHVVQDLPKYGGAPNVLSCLAPPNRRIGFPHYEASKRGWGVKMAVIIGAPPEVVLASQAKLDFRSEKYIVAARLCPDNKLKMRKCVTSDLLVPLESEIVLECTTIPNSEYNDTPFGEYPGTYSMRSNSWLCVVDHITLRTDAMYQTILTGKTPQEDSNLCAFPYAAEVYRVAKNFVSEVTDISAFIGNNVFDTIICVKKNSNEEIQNLMHALLANRYLKSVTVMDADLKATEHDWRFAFNTRYQPNRDTIITNLGLGASLDPSSPLFQSTSKIALDFTIPIGKTAEETEAMIRRHEVVTAKGIDLVDTGKWIFP